MHTLSLLTVLGIVAAGQPAATPPKPTTPPAAASAAQPAGGPFRVIKSFDVGGDGGWDDLKVDPEARRLYVPRSTRVMVLDADTGAKVGEIADTPGVHAVALAPELGKGFTSNGKDDSVTVFDTKTLKTIQTVKAGKNPDAIIYEPATKRVFVFNGRSNDATVIGAEDLAVAGTVALGGKPEFAAVDGHGTVFVNVEDTSELLRIDAKTLQVEQRIPLAPGKEPTGLAIDGAHHLLFAACNNEMMVVVDAESGKVLATPAIGKGVDGAAFDAAGGFALSSNGEGTLTVVATGGDKPFTVVQTLKTAPRARTMTLDPKTRHGFLPTAEFEAAAPDKDGKPQRPAMKPGTFRIIVVGT